MTRPLDGVRVLDLTRLLPGPFATLVLADLGAQVDKVEDPHGGDYLRHMPPQLGDQNAAFLALNRGKRSIVLDLKRPEARDALLRMLPGYDVLIEQFRPGVLDRLGLSHESLRQRFPRLVIAAITGYGQDGPLAQRAGHDLNYLARSGILGLTGPSDGPPQPPGFQLADVGGGMWAVIGVLGALRARDRTGQGSVIDVAMSESTLPFAMVQLGTLFGNARAARGGEPLTGGIAPYNTYATSDGRFVSLGALEPKFWRSFCEGVGLEFDMGAMMPGPHQAALEAKLAEIFATRTRDEWTAFNAERDCCLEPVLEPAELRDDPQLKARRVFVEQSTRWGTSTQVRLPIAEPADAPAPAMGEHTRAVLQDAGFSPDEIEALLQCGAARAG
ncbi:MAG: CoA transferase [Deltaproteobacteria bacterium]|nr:CoA transferase [Deltaproteobacteria bacterium]